jgi:hypothetical protein
MKIPPPIKIPPAVLFTGSVSAHKRPMAPRHMINTSRYDIISQVCNIVKNHRHQTVISGQLLNVTQEGNIIRHENRRIICHFESLFGEESARYEIHAGDFEMYIYAFSTKHSVHIFSAFHELSSFFEQPTSSLTSHFNRTSITRYDRFT